MSNGSVWRLAHWRLIVFSTLLIALMGAFFTDSVAEAAANDLFFSEYIEGSSNNKAIEIYNGTGADVDLSTYVVELYSNGNTTPNNTETLSGTLADGAVFVIANSQADQAILDVADITSSVTFFNGDDALVLKNNGAVIDVIGQVGTDPGSEWGSGDVSTGENTIRRQASVCEGDTDETDAFDPTLEWDGFPQNTFDGLGSHTANCTPPVAVDLLFSEYIEGSSNNKAIEIYNGTGADVDLSTYVVELYSNGNTTPNNTETLSGTLADGAVFVIANSQADQAILDVADITSSVTFFNGDDALVLKNNGAVIDVIGQVGTDPGSEWGSGDVSTGENTIRRQASVCEGDTDETDAFDPTLEWDGFPQNTFDGLGSHSITCDNGGPSGADLELLLSLNGTTFSEGDTVTLTATVKNSANTPDDATNVAASVYLPVEDVLTNVTNTCDAALNGTTLDWSVGTVISGGEASCTFEGTITSGTDGNAYTVKAQVTGVDQDDPDSTPNSMDPASTPSEDDEALAMFNVGQNPVCETSAQSIGEVQGAGNATPFDGQTVTVEGIVTADYQTTNLEGFFLQDDNADGNPATSDGIFVYDPDKALDVSVGQPVRIENAEADERFGMTQLRVVGGAVIIDCSGGDNTSSPTPAVITLPVPPEISLDAFYEPYEGMLVRFEQELTVTEMFQLGRFGELRLSQGGRLRQFTEDNMPSVTGYEAHLDEIARRSILLDDDNNLQNAYPVYHPQPGGLSPDNTVRGGDSITNLTGVLHWSWGGNSASPDAWRIRPVDGVYDYSFTPNNPRPAMPADVGGDLRVAAFNVLNYFNGDGAGGGFPTSRGADTLEDFGFQRDKIIAAITTMDAHVVGLMEIENDGYGPDSAIADLVNGLNAALGSEVYAFIDAGGPIGTDEIAVGLIYQPARVTPIGNPAILDSSIDPNFVDTKNRPMLTQTFEENSSGERFTVAVNHLKSKGSDCDDLGDPNLNDGQGNCNVTRTQAAQAIIDWLATDPTGSGDPDFLVMGDINAYSMEDPIAAFENAGYTNLGSAFLTNGYSYVFDGQWGSLDHALANAALFPQVTGVTKWHINADEPSALSYSTRFDDPALRDRSQYRSSDHDPVIVGLNLTTPDTTPPEVTITPDPSNSNGDTFNISIAFSEPVTGFTVEDIIVSGGTLSDFTVVDDANYTAVLTITEDSVVTINVNPDVAQDAAGNGNTAAPQTGVVRDTVAPDVTIIPDADLINVDSVGVTVRFSEPVRDFTVEDITLSGGTASNFMQTGQVEYSFDLNVTEDGTYTIYIAAGAAQDDAGNDSTAATPATVIRGDIVNSVDVNDDGTVTPTDAIFVINRVGLDPADAAHAAADIDGDGDIDTTDVALVINSLGEVIPTGDADS